MNPIEKHRSQIEKKISQLEQQFNKDRFDVRDPHKRHREYVPDENKVYGNPLILSKTMEVKGRLRGPPGQIARLKKDYAPNERSYFNQVLGELKQQQKNTPSRDNYKEEKIKELQYMVKSLLEGQRLLKKELHDLKTQNIKEQITKSKLSDESPQQYTTPLTKIQPPNDKSVSNIDQSKEPRIGKKRSSMANNSLVVAEGTSREKITHKGSGMNKRKDFQQLYQQLKERSRGDRRWVVQEEWKSRMWAQVESRVRQSDKEYKDTMHRNNKHQFEYLMNTYELQRKLKDDLIAKVYQQCNDQIYK